MSIGNPKTNNNSAEFRVKIEKKSATQIFAIFRGLRRANSAARVKLPSSAEKLWPYVHI